MIEAVHQRGPDHDVLKISTGKRRVGLLIGQSNDGGSIPGGPDHDVLNIPPGKSRVGLLKSLSNDGGSIPGGPDHDVLNIPPGKRRVVSSNVRAMMAAVYLEVLIMMC